jgi:O-antigen/teichoic acid export membrane protein
MATVPAWALLLLFQAFLQSQERWSISSAILHVVQPVTFGLGLAVLWLVDRLDRLDAVLAALAVSVVVAAVVAARTVWSGVPDALRQGSVGAPPPPASDSRLVTGDDEAVEQARWRAAARSFFSGHLAITVTGSADVLILAMFAPREQVALYAIASRVALLARSINSGIEAIVAPRLAQGWSARRPDRIQREVDMAIALAAGPTIALATAIVVFREPLLGIVGDDYRAAGPVLVILLIGNVVQALTGPCGYVVSLTDNERVHARIMMTAAATLVAGCLAVAGPGGPVAVAAVTTMVTASWNLALVVAARRLVGIRCHPRPGMLRSRGRAKRWRPWTTFEGTR